MCVCVCVCTSKQLNVRFLMRTNFPTSNQLGINFYSVSLH